MAGTLKRSTSKDYMIDFASYFDTNKPRMKDIVSQLDEICEEVKKRKDHVPMKASHAAVGAGAVGILLAAFTGGLSLVLGGVAALIAAGAVVVYDRITDRDTLEKVKDLVTEFCDLVKPLKDVDREKRQMFETLDRKVERMLSYFQTLIKGLYVLFIDFNKDSTVQRLLEVTKQCRHILKEVEELAEQMKLEELKKL